MIPPPDHKPAELRSSVRMDARLDQTTRQKVDELAARFHQPRAAVLHHIIHWGLTHGHAGPLDHGDSPVRHLYLSVAADLHEQVQKAAIAAGLKIAPWLRDMVRQISMADFPASGQEATPREHSHDSRLYIKRFMLRLDKLSQTKLEHLIKACGTSKAEIICHLLVQATPEDFPKRWHLTVAKRHVPHVR
jgi:hypothetical protein